MDVHYWGGNYIVIKTKLKISKTKVILTPLNNNMRTDSETNSGTWKNTYLNNSEIFFNSKSLIQFKEQQN